MIGHYVDLKSESLYKIRGNCWLYGQKRKLMRRLYSGYTMKQKFAYLVLLLYLRHILLHWNIWLLYITQKGIFSWLKRCSSRIFIIHFLHLFLFGSFFCYIAKYCFLEFFSSVFFSVMESLTSIFYDSKTFTGIFCKLILYTVIHGNFWVLFLLKQVVMKRLLIAYKQLQT